MITAGPARGRSRLSVTVEPCTQGDEVLVGADNRACVLGLLGNRGRALRTRQARLVARTSGYRNVSTSPKWRSCLLTLAGAGEQRPSTVSKVKHAKRARTIRSSKPFAWRGG